MNAKVTLTARQRYVLRFATRGAGPEAGLLQFAWVYINGVIGEATASVTDTDGVNRGPWPIPVPGVLASVIRESTEPNQSSIVIEASEQGFQGEISIDLTNRA
jgi:hypothetical protein